MKKRSNFIIIDHPWIIDLFGSRNPVQVLLYLGPIFYFLVSKLLNESSLSILTVICFLSLGTLLWTLLEYLIHRYLYHSKLSVKLFSYTIGSFHLYHHQNMFDLRVLNAGFFMIYGAAAALLYPVLLISESWTVTASFGLGLLLGYYFYEWIHYLIHYKKYESGYLKYIQKYHFHHHHHDHACQKNFGNTSHLWDVVFRTYDGRYQDYQMPVKTENSLITSQKSKKSELVNVRA